MPNDSKLLDDLARVAGGAVSLISTVRSQIQADVRSRVDSYADRLDLVSRAEVERLQALVAALRSEQDALKKRVAELEVLAGGKKTSVKKTPSRPAKSKRN